MIAVFNFTNGEKILLETMLYQQISKTLHMFLRTNIIASSQLAC